MSIISIEFTSFAILVFIIYYLIPTRQGRKFWLLGMSGLFYLSWDWTFLFVLLILGWLNFSLGQHVHKNIIKSKTWLRIGILINIGAVAVFKYNDFFLPTLITFFENLGIKQLENLNILLPIGLSFFAVQGISYLVDIYLKRMEPEQDLTNFWLYTLYFPKLLSGPIERAKRLIAQINAPQAPSPEMLTTGFGLIIIGSFRKLVFADPLTSLIPEAIFEQPGEYFSPVLAGWLLAYGVALYNDFAGYSAMMRGISYMFGIELSQNFKNPYFSKNFTEFWARWHISLSNWLRDYIYFPLRRRLVQAVPNRNHIINIIIPPMITMIVSAIWHGVSLNMLFWGGLHGVYQIIEHMIKRIPKGTFTKQRQAVNDLVGIGTTAIFTMLAWVPFKAELSIVFIYWQKLFFLPHWSRLTHILSQHIQNPNSEWMIWELQVIPDIKALALIGMSFMFDWLQNKNNTEILFAKWPRFYKYAFIGIILTFMFLIEQADTQAPFIYQGF